MSVAVTRVDSGTETRDERLLSWFAALLSALLHLLMLLVLLHASTPVMTPPQGAASGGRTKVDFIGETQPADPPVPVPTNPSPTQERVKARPAASRVQSTLVIEADEPVLVDATGTQPDRRLQEDAVQNQAQTPPTPTVPTRRRPGQWGRPPGFIEEEVPPEGEGLSRSAVRNNGNQHDVASAEPSMEVGGYQVYYTLRGESRLRAWMAEGMKELSLPLPGTRFYMVCPAQVALDRGSGNCRLLAPDSPELTKIGDAREVIDMMQVYRQGELVWRGPGPYR